MRRSVGLGLGHVTRDGFEVVVEMEEGFLTCLVGHNEFEGLAEVGHLAWVGCDSNIETMWGRR